MTDPPDSKRRAGQSRHEAVVVFGDQVGLFWLRPLKPGFRHCFVLLEQDEGWVMLDPLAHRIRVAMLPPVASGDLAAWYREHGYGVVVVPLATAPKRPAPWGPFTCVEAVKRALGIHRVTVWTPWQLWRYLIIGKNS